MSNFNDSTSNFHPYECDGPGKCIHCDRTETLDHDPEICELCIPKMKPEIIHNMIIDWKNLPKE